MLYQIREYASETFTAFRDWATLQFRPNIIILERQSVMDLNTTAVDTRTISYIRTYRIRTYTVQYTHSLNDVLHLKTDFMIL